MKQIIPFVSDVSLDTKISEITSIALEHNLQMENSDSVVGVFTISGKYKINEISVNEEVFEKEIPYDITLDDKYDASKVMIDIDDFYYEMSILKSADASGSACDRFLFSYPDLCGRGHLLHTYQADGDPLPSFTGEPRRVRIDDDIDAFTAHLWQGLHGANRISLYVRYTDLQTKKYTDRVINQYEGACEKCRNTH